MYNKTMNGILCPTCFDELSLSDEYGCCKNHHTYQINNGILDLMPIITNRTLLDESEHFDRFLEVGYPIDEDPYISSKLEHRSKELFEKVIKQECPDFANRRICIAEIGCGEGSAFTYLGRLPFQSVNYIGIDISQKSLQYVANNRVPPPNWNSLLVRTSANTALFMNESLDIVFSLGTLHHLHVANVIDWVSKSLKPGGLLIIEEPSEGNPFAKVGRRFTKEYITQGERPLNPRNVKELAVACGLRSVYERGINFLTGPLSYLLGIRKTIPPIKICSYLFSQAIDYVVRNQSVNYEFIHIYKKDK
jgi:SAM-dependent methyltransferase